MLKKKRFIPQLSDVTPTTEDFASLLESVSTSHVKEGMVVKGQVVEANSDVIVVDVGLKNEGRIDISEFQTITNQELPPGPHSLMGIALITAGYIKNNYY